MLQITEKNTYLKNVIKNQLNTNRVIKKNSIKNQLIQTVQNIEVSFNVNNAYLKKNI